MLRIQFVDLFLGEARITARLSHPNIVYLHDFGRVGGAYYLAMEYVNGVTVRQLLGALAAEPLPPHHAARVAADVAAALHCAHRLRDESGRPLGVVHRDVSPTNILLSFGGIVKLADFGVARAAIETETTVPSLIAGKYGYMSPEQCLGLPLDHRSDIFSLGIVLFEMLVGAKLYRSGNAFQTMQSIIAEPPSRVRSRRPEVPPELDSIVARAVSREPQDRFESAGAMQLALEQYLSSQGTVCNAGGLATLMERHASVTPALLDPAGVTEIANRTAPAVTNTAPRARVVRVRSARDLSDVRNQARQLCEQLAASSFFAQKVVTAASELARNLAAYAGGGVIELRPVDDSPRRVVVRAVDEGPGIPNLDEILAGRYRSRSGLGKGLLGCKQLASRFDVESSPSGTRVELELTV